MKRTLDDSTQNMALWCGGVFVGVIVAQLLSAALWNHQGGSHVVWFPGAVLLGVLLSAPRSRWLALMVAALTGLVATGAAFGLPLTDTALVVSPPVLLTPVAAWILLRLPGDAPLLEDFRKLFAFAATGVVALPALCAVLIEYASRYTTLHGTILSDWPNIALAHALGYVLYIPVWITARSPGAAVRQAGRVSPDFILAMAGSTVLLGITWFALGGHPALLPLLCLAPAPILIAAVVRAQMTGSSFVVFAIVVMAAHLSVQGYGPFVAETPQRTTLAVQLWTLSASLCALTVSVIVEQWHASQRALNRARNDMRELAGHLIATQEQERARLARDLHDDINQRLAATSINLSALRRRVLPEAGDDVSRIQAQVIALSDDLRQMSHQLHPGWLSHTGLRDSLDALCAAPRDAAGPRCILSVDEKAGALPGDVALCIYRIVQEALANALRHAAATRIDVEVSVSAAQAILHIVDDGRGFDAGSVQTRGPGIGLISMSERAKLLGGSFDMHSAPGKGVDLCIRIPLTSD